MKKIFLAAIAATTLFAACNKENANTTEAAGSPAKLSIVFKNSAHTRAFDTTDETVINNATAFVLNEAGEIMAEFFIPTSEINEGEEYEITTAARKVVVIANTDLTGLGLSSLSALKNAMATLEALDGSEGFFASGTSAALSFDEVATTDGVSPLAEAEVTMNLLPAKLNVTVVNSMENYDFEDGEKGLILNDVAILYSAGFSHWVAATENGTDFYPLTTAVVSPAKYFRSGFLGWDEEITAQNDVFADLCQTWADTEEDFKETFYTYPIASGAHSKNTILVVRATWHGEDGTATPEYRYFPVHFTTSDVGELVSGREYNVTITLSGDAEAGGGSVIDPEDEVVTAYFTVAVEIAAWEATTPIVKEFN